MVSVAEVDKPINDILASPEQLRRKKLIVSAHGYQPQREAFLSTSGDRLSVVPEINEIIYGQVYRPILVEGESLSRDLVFSFYPGVRDWIKSNHPEDFQKIVEKINALPNKEYKVLGDPFLHDILSLLPREDQDMLVKIGREAFNKDLGFYPKGFWAPETAISAETLDVLVDNGYEFVVLRDSQLRRADGNPIKVITPNGKGITVLHFNSELSGSLSFDPEVSKNADEFLNRLAKIDSNIVSFASDMELYGHHQPDRDKFLLHLEKDGILESHGFIPLDLKASLDPGKMDYLITEVWDNTSWSCEHKLGRWTGECGCDNPNKDAITDKRHYYQTLNTYGEEINARLEAEKGTDWRDKFIDFFFARRTVMFTSGTVDSATDNNLFWAKYAELVGRISCGWFFGNEKSPEREIPRAMIGEIEALVPDICERTIFLEQKAA